jgi:hypothetical protein
MNGGCQGGTCGKIGQACCSNGLCTDAFADCGGNNQCRACGGLNQGCCPGNAGGDFCQAGFVCTGGGQCVLCGGNTQRCCPGNTCPNSTNHTCAFAGGPATCN